MISRLCLPQARAGICSAASLVHSQPQLLCLQLKAASAAVTELQHTGKYSTSNAYICSHSLALPGCSTCAGISNISSRQAPSNSNCTSHISYAVSSSSRNSSRNSSVWHKHSVLASRGLSTSSSCWQAADSSNAGISRSSGTVKPTDSSSTSSSSSSGGDSGSSSRGDSGDPKFQVPPAVAAGAAAAGDAAAKAAKAAAKQASWLVKLVQSTSLSEATWLQLSSIWQSHSTTITAVTAAAATAGVYHLAAAIAGQFVNIADPKAFWACLSASAAAVAVAGIQIRSSFTVDAERVYHITMRKLNRHAGLQEVMGSPLAGSDVRLELVSQGSLFVQETLLPKRRAPRIHLMFQLTGPTKTGVVSVVAKKAFGSKYAFRTLMVELPDKTLTSEVAAAAGTAALARAEAAQAQVSRPSSISSSNGSSSIAGEGGSSSSSSSASGGAAATAAAEPARIYIIGAPAGTSSSSSGSPRPLSPTALLEDLKDPLLYALKHNLVGYEAEDETEGQLAWSKPQQDPDQTTWWDDTKAASKLLACRAYSGARKAATAVLDAASKVGAKLRASAAASAATSSSARSSSSSGGASSGGSSSTTSRAGSSSSSSSTSGGSSSGPGVAGQPAALTITTTTTSSGASSMSATTSSSEGSSSSGSSSGRT